MVVPQARGLIFDCDGTLVDSMPAHIAAWMETLARHGLKIVPQDIHDFAGKPSEEVVRCLAQRYQKELDGATIAEEKNALVRGRLVDVKAIEPVVEVARACADKLPMAIVSGSRRVIVDIELAAVGIAGLFRIIITPEDGYPSKPSPAPFLAAAARMGVEPRCCQVFEDGEQGLLAARLAGMIATDIRAFTAP